MQETTLNMKLNGEVLKNEHPADEEAVTAMIRDGVEAADDLKSAVVLAYDKMAGNVPLGATAPNKGLRKCIGASHEVLSVIKWSIRGIILAPIGLLCLSSYSSGSGPSALVLGVGFLALGLFSMHCAYHSYRTLRAILRA